MTMMPGSYAPGPQLRASDADRDRVLAELSSSFEAGRLTSEEFDERTSRALASRTTGELAALTADLPAGQSAGVPPGPAAPGSAAAWPGFQHRQARLPVVAIIAVIAVVAVAAGAASLHAWWFAIVPVLVIRAVTMRRGGRGSGPLRRNWR
jgi:hypothetical protein